MARRQRARVEEALDRELRDHPEVGAGDRAMLRAQARAVDIAEAAADVEAITDATHGYLRIRIAVGLTGGVSAAVDPFDQLLRELSQPRVGDPSEPSPS